ncbi:flagellar brake protein [Alteromonas pelagimontana]|uniref:Flagellar brake protein n=1 Tax=Alteromonas pelagimontana TaxID=1858656 RepID=A0A6M4MIV3_9ALTE|nr:flagellar brake protein [Alteromonas pelagimontana]QJR82565.1 flagellar brake protein [Alteromonas pelagimontana]
MESQQQAGLCHEDLQCLKGLIPGSSVDLQITTPTAPKRVKTQYIGMDIPNGVMFQIPINPRWSFVRDLLVPGNTIIVRYVLEGETGQVIAFRVKVIRLMSKPFSMLITTFPRSIQTIGLRSEKRNQPGIAVDIVAEGLAASEAVSGVIVDVSTKGCRVALPINQQCPQLENNNLLTLHYKLEGEPITITGQIKNKTQEAGHLYYGIQFDEDQPAVEILLERHILIE